MMMRRYTVRESVALYTKIYALGGPHCTLSASNVSKYYFIQTDEWRVFRLT